MPLPSVSLPSCVGTTGLCGTCRSARTAAGSPHLGCDATGSRRWGRRRSGTGMNLRFLLRLPPSPASLLRAGVLLQKNEGMGQLGSPSPHGRFPHRHPALLQQLGEDEAALIPSRPRGGSGGAQRRPAMPGVVHDDVAVLTHAKTLVKMANTPASILSHALPGG